MIEHASRKKYLACDDGTLTLQSESEGAVRQTLCPPYFDSAKGDVAIASKLPVRNATELRGMDAIACQEAVHFLGRPTARRSGIAEKDLPTGTSQHQGGTEAGRACAGNDHVPSAPTHENSDRIETSDSIARTGSD
jgi:hypothetical protein